MRSIPTHEFRVLMARQKQLSPRKVSGVMKWKSTVENSGLLGATVLDLKELPLILQNEFAACALDATYWTNTHMVTSLLNFREACVFVCVCAYVCVWVCVHVQRHTLTYSVLDPLFFARTVDPRWKCDVNLNKKKNRLGGGELNPSGKILKLGWSFEARGGKLSYLGWGILLSRVQYFIFLGQHFSMSMDIQENPINMLTSSCIRSI